MVIYIAYAFSAFFLVNGIPHFVHGVSGHRFQSPFAHPPGVGESSPLVNVLWGSFNFFVSALLLNYAGLFDIGHNIATYVFFAAALLSAIVLAVVFGRIRNTPLKGRRA